MDSDNKESGNFIKNSISRRQAIKQTAAMGLAAGVPFLTGVGCESSFGRQNNPVRQENNNPGSTDWQLTRVRADGRDAQRTSWIEGYCSRQSVEAGDTIDIMVSVDPVREFGIEIFRMGY